MLKVARLSASFCYSLRLCKITPLGRQTDRNMEDENSTKSKTVPDDLTTVYRREYVPIKAVAQFEAIKDDKRTFTVVENYEFVNLSDRSPSPPPEPYDMAVEFLENTFKYKQPKLYKKYFQEPLSRENVDEELLKGTVYYKEYCSHEKIPKRDEINLEVAFPETLRTSQRDHYRQPSTYGKIIPTVSCSPLSMMSTNQGVISSINQVKLISEYQRLIGTTGTFILDTEMLGKVTYPS